MKKILIFSVIIFLIFIVFFTKQQKKQISKNREEKSIVVISPKPLQIEPLTLEKIFFGDKSYLKKLDQNDLISIISTGDIIPARMVNLRAIQNNDFTWSYKNVWSLLKNADLTVANFESPIFESCLPTSEGMVFCGSNKHTEGLKFSGIDLVSLANNHIDNYEAPGVDETIKLLKENKIEHTGLNKTTFISLKNLQLAFLGWNFLSEPKEEEIIGEIQKAKQSSDFVIVFPHWGTEYQELPDAFQTKMSKILLENGADIIIGNHPHIIQPISVENNTLSFFAHGNFIFDQEWSENTKKGFIAKTYIYEGKVIDVEIIPIYIKDYGQPEIISGEKKDTVIKDLYKLSLKYSQIIKNQ